jgi:hypothetical protein
MLGNQQSHGSIKHELWLPISKKKLVKMRKTKKLKVTLGDQEGGSMIAKKTLLCAMFVACRQS